MPFFLLSLPFSSLSHYFSQLLTLTLTYFTSAYGLSFVQCAFMHDCLMGEWICLFVFLS